MTKALTLCWGRVPRGRTLFIVLAYHGNDRDDCPGLFTRFESPAARGHRIVHRNHYANPRPLAYSLALVDAAAEAIASHPPDVVLDEAFGPVTDQDTTRLNRITRIDPLAVGAWQAEPLAASNRYDQIVLVYCDALGLGCDEVEKQVLSRHARVLVVNGRRRAFRLDGVMQLRLAAHRFLAHTRIVDSAIGIALRCAGSWLASMDRRHV